MMGVRAGACEPRMPAPATPPAPQQMPVLASETSSDYASSFPASCSPLLPFAFTPSVHSLASLPDNQVHACKILKPQTLNPKP